MAETTRQQQLQRLAQTTPASPLGQSTDIGIQQAVSKVPTSGVSSTQLSQDIGAQSAQMRGQERSQAIQSEAARQTQLGQMSLAEQGRDNRLKLSRRNIALQEQSRTLTTSLQKLDRTIKNQIFDSNIEFKKDELGRQTFNTRQLLDYAILKATKDEGLRNYEQNISQAFNRKKQILVAAQNKITAAMKNQFETRQQEENQEAAKELQEAKRRVSDSINKIQSDSRNYASMLTAGGTMLGIAAGIVLAPFTGGMSLAVAPALGSALGGVVAGATSDTSGFDNINTKVGK